MTTVCLHGMVLEHKQKLFLTLMFCVLLNFHGLAHPPIQWVPRALSSGIKQPEFQVENSPTSSADNVWSYTSPIHVHGMVLSKHRDNFTLTLCSNLYKIKASSQ
jgi:hypothetical protein